MEISQMHEDFDLEVLESRMNSYQWSQIDSETSPLPKNSHYQVVIQDPSIQKYYQRFRFIMQNQNTYFLPQTLALSTYLLKSFTNNYYALMLRKKIVSNEIQRTKNSSKPSTSQTLSEISRISERQLNFMNNLLEDNPKEYHIWTYKKDLITRVFENLSYSENQTQKAFFNSFRQSIYMKENKFIFALLNEDCRNYHAWDYRFWLVTCLGKIRQELRWIEDLINDSKEQSSVVKQIKDKLSGTELETKQLKVNWVNVNSLWSHKFNLIKFLNEGNTKLQLKQKESMQLDTQRKFENGFTNQVIMQIVVEEIQGSIKLILADNQNECIWNYLKGMIKFSEEKYPSEVRERQKLNLIRDVMFKVESWEQIEQSLGKLNRFELSFLRTLIPKITPLQKQSQLQTKIINQLKTIDNVRHKYYEYLEKNNQHK